jgi:D-proline reductase (dithiol) PrdB
VPVLARWIEGAGIPTVVVTMMPAAAEERRAPRIVGVEFPFGHPFGMPGDKTMQRRVLELALRVLAGAGGFGTRVDVDIEWPVPLREAYKAWQPKEASPIVRKLLASPPPGA